MTHSQEAYPVQFTVEYPDRPLDRFTTLFRLIAAIPIAVVASLVGGGSSGGGLLYAPPLMILFRQKYPRWWFDWSVALLKFENRVVAYLLLLRDEYPSTDEEQMVHLSIPYPDVERDLHRWLPLVKWILAIPHYLVLMILSLVLIVVVLAAWFAILFTGPLPERPLRLRCRNHALVQQGDSVRICPLDGPLPTLPPRTVAGSPDGFS